jgi:endogenous inhibitor of DNA gyrase (YacG/DUF329 family)
MKARRLNLADCPVCGQPVRAGTRYVHRRCQRVLKRQAREKRTHRAKQLRFVENDGRMAPLWSWGAPPLHAAVAPLRPVAPAPLPLEAYPNVPGKCGLCGERVRNKTRQFHRTCLNYLLDPPPPPPPKPLPVHYPAPRWCEPCRRLDNSLYPAKNCARCGRETTDPPPNLSRTR